jgi:hypothetical protein
MMTSKKSPKKTKPRNGMFTAGLPPKKTKAPKKTKPRNGMFTAGLPPKKTKAPKRPEDTWKIVRYPATQGPNIERTCHLEKVALHLYDGQVEIADLEGGRVEILQKLGGSFQRVAWTYRTGRSLASKSPIKTPDCFRSVHNGQVRLDGFCSAMRVALDRFQTSNFQLGPSPTAESDNIWYQLFLDFCKTLPVE